MEESEGCLLKLGCVGRRDDVSALMFSQNLLHCRNAAKPECNLAVLEVAPVHEPVTCSQQSRAEVMLSRSSPNLDSTPCSCMLGCVEIFTKRNGPKHQMVSNRTWNE